MSRILISARDQFLDFLKGAAIILVVLGHHLQGADSAFDDNLRFRLVYSFHMPLFMFAGGWAASIRFRNRFTSAQTDTATELARLPEVLLKKAIRLLLPFCSSGAVMYFTRPNYALMPAVDYMVLLFRNADNGLWFLPALFFCHVFIQLAWLGCVFLNSLSRRSFPRTLLLASVVCSFALLIVSPGVLGLTFAKAYYPYFVCGVLWGYLELKRLPKVFHELPYFLFLCLFPLWHRTEPSPICINIVGLLDLRSPPPILNLLVGGSGVYVFVQVLTRIYDSAATLVNVATKYIGSRTLDIYAAHFIFLGFFPGVFDILFSIIASLFLSVILRGSGFLVFVFLGENLFGKPTKIIVAD